MNKYNKMSLNHVRKPLKNSHWDYLNWVI